MYLFCALTAAVVAAAGVVYETEATEYNGHEECISYPDGHCVLEGRAKVMCSSYLRYAFDWETKTCVTIYWSGHCGRPGEGPNMFMTEKRCSSTCGAWSD